MKRDISKHKSHLKVRAMYDYVKEKGIEPKQLTEKELDMFLGPKWTFRESMYPMSREDKCCVCGKITDYVDKIHFVYTCSQKCMDVVDARYDNGEDIEKHKIIYDILVANERSLFE